MYGGYSNLPARMHLFKTPAKKAPHKLRGFFVFVQPDRVTSSVRQLSLCHPFLRHLL